MSASERFTGVGIRRRSRKVEAQSHPVGARVEPVAIDAQHHRFSYRAIEPCSAAGVQRFLVATVHLRDYAASTCASVCIGGANSEADTQ